MWGSGEGQLFYSMFVGLVEARLDPMLAVKKRQRLDVLSSLGLLIDVSSDGKTFLIAQPTAEKPQVIVTLNWAASVRAPLR